MKQVLLHQILLRRLIRLLKSYVDKLDNDELKNVPSGVSSLKSKVDIRYR